MRAIVLALLLTGCAGCATATRWYVEQTTPVGGTKPDSLQALDRKVNIRYPRRWLRFHMVGSGAPLLRADGSLNGPLADSLARYDAISMYVIPLVARPDIVDSLKRRNPNLMLIGELPGGVWENPHPFLGDTIQGSPHEDLAWARWRVIRDNDAFLYGTDGGWLAEDDNVDRSNHRAELALAGVDARAAVPAVDGLWLDTICLGEGWRESPLDSVDYARAGFSCRADWERDYAIGHRMYVSALRDALGDSAILVGNCGPGGEQDILNGWMREGFPFQDGGSWWTNMLGFDGHPGYLTENYQRPHLSILSGFRSGDARADSIQMVFGLASATLGDGVWEQVAKPTAVTGDPETSIQYWPPQFNMDLGLPKGPAYYDSTTFSPSHPTSVWRRDFTRGEVVVDPYARTGKVVAR